MDGVCLRFAHNTRVRSAGRLESTAAAAGAGAMLLLWCVLCNACSRVVEAPSTISNRRARRRLWTAMGAAVAAVAADDRSVGRSVGRPAGRRPGWRSLITPTDGDAADYRSRLGYRSDGRLAASQAGCWGGGRERRRVSMARGRSYWPRRRRRTSRFVRWRGIPLIIEHSRLLRPCARDAVGDASRHGARSMRPPAVGPARRCGRPSLITPSAVGSIARPSLC